MFEHFGDFAAQLRRSLAAPGERPGRDPCDLGVEALGENIGYGLLLTQNNPGGLYFASPTGITGKWIHNALMGDPTLRSDVVSPVSNVIATKVGN